MLNGAWAIAIALALQSAPPPASAPAPWPDDRPLTRLFQNLAHDIVALPSKDTAILLGLGAGGSLFVHSVDDNLASWAARSGDSSYTAAGRIAGDGWTQAGAAVATYAIGHIAKNDKAIHVGSDLIRGQALNGLLTTIAKNVASRDRPTGSRHAFPSGHTSAAFTTAGVLQSHFGWKAGIPTYAFASFIGWTRVRDRQHWMSDVVAGAALGTIVGHTVTKGHRARTWTVTPTKTAGGFAIYVMRIAPSNY